MSYILIIIIVLAVLAALIFAQRISQKEKQKREVKAQAKRILLRADDIWDAAENTSTIIDAPEILDALMDFYKYQLRRRDELINPDDTQDLCDKADNFKNTHNPSTVKNELKSDMEINLAKRSCARTSKLLRSANKLNLLTGKACNAMRNALRRRLLDLEVEAYIRLGDAAGEKENPAVATNHYKFAKKLLIESDLKFDGKNELVRSISNKTQRLFGNAVEDQLSRDLKSEKDKEATDAHGIPRDLDVMTGNKKKF